MKIVNNYDFINAVKDSNEDYSPSKVIRNHKGPLIVGLSVVTYLNCIAFDENLLKHISDSTLVFSSAILISKLMEYKYHGDKYKQRADERLNELVDTLNDNDIKTDNHLIRQSTCYNKIYNLQINNKAIPQILESKYIYVPMYNFKGNVINTSLLQEHIIGTNEYTLSLGSPIKVLKKAYTMA